MTDVPDDDALPVVLPLEKLEALKNAVEPVPQSALSKHLQSLIAVKRQVAL